MGISGEQNLEHGYGEKLTLRLTLNNGSLPSRRTLDWLLDRNALDSDLMSVQAYGQDAMEIKGLLDLLYTAMDSPARILELPDYSQNSLELNALGILAGMREGIKDNDTEIGDSSLN